MTDPVVQALVIAAIAAAMTLSALLALSAFRGKPGRVLAPPSAGASLLFEGEDLVDAAGSGLVSLGLGKTRGTDLARTVRALSPVFPDLKGRLAGLVGNTRLRLAGRDGTILMAERRGETLRIDLGPDTGQQDDGLAAVRIAALEQELETLGAVGTASPFPIWRQDRDGAITWANRAFVDLSDRLSGSAPQEPAAWPPTPLFEALAAGVASDRPVTQRLPLTLPGEAQPRWYDVTSAWIGDETVHFAQDVTAIVSAEAAQQVFVSTLSDTFAALSTGLCVFASDRRLVLFNPAFVDLTGLEVAFLVNRPDLPSVFDRLREAGVMQEPKDYMAWRQRLADMQEGAASGTFDETWHLSDGRVFRISGRPHPNGAIAFLLEDISAEVTLTRTFRDEIELYLGLIDGLDEAIAVFSPTGALLLTNAAYRALWHDGLDDLTDRGAGDEIEMWRRRCGPTPLWGELVDFLSQRTGRGGWSEEVSMPDLGPVTVRIDPGPSGSTIVQFERRDADDVAGQVAGPSSGALA